MDILFYHPSADSNDWIARIMAQLPNANVYTYHQGATQTADYALVWDPTREILSHQDNLKGIFILGAGVDKILNQQKRMPGLLPQNVPLYRLEDAGMALQMQEYAIASVMRYFRRLDEYYQQQQHKQWHVLSAHSYEEFVIGVMGLGVLGEQVATRLAALGFKVKGWSRSKKSIDHVDCYSQNQHDEFISGTKLLINLLPCTPQTQGILNKSLFTKLEDGAYLINLARGNHVVEEDLLNAIANKKIKAATLDVFATEPLPSEHPFWCTPEITITPHISALTQADKAIPQIVEKILRIEKGEKVAEGLIDLEKGY
ncbi:2-hydroxyacid dehydrogenase [Orbus mooreae]|uniref:2-hydroxyacid dehydrogenase n=1 Tax=Orbus mooreae TaxID=3074107 RepID=UPI00370D15B4